MFDIYQEVTDRIIAQMEKGIIPWRKPWSGNSISVSHETGKPYSLLNQFLLEEPGEYATFKQINEHGGKVKKGSKSKIVVFWKMLEKEKKDKNGAVILGKDDNPLHDMIPYLKYINVFNVLTDCEGIEPKYMKPTEKEEDVHAAPVADVMLHEYLKRCAVGFDLAERDESFYRPSTDTIYLPLMENFHSIAEFYSTAFHEAVHSTGHESRLDRLSKDKFGSESYSKEELVAEIGAACLVSRSGLETEDSFKNSTAYVQNWLSALKNDKKLIISAAGKAEKAVKFILNEEENANVA